MSCKSISSVIFLNSENVFSMASDFWNLLKLYKLPYSMWINFIMFHVNWKYVFYRIF